MIADDGSVVVFVSDAPDIVAGDTNGSFDVFVWSRVSGAIEIESLTSNGAQVPAGSFFDVDVSADGRYVVFASNNPLVPEDTNGTTDVYLRDRVAHTTELVSVANDGTVGDKASAQPSINADGSAISFTSLARNLVTEPLNGFSAIFVRDRTEARTSLVSRFSLAGRSGAPANHNSYLSSISGDGRYVAFTTLASNLWVTEHIGQTDVYVYDRRGLGGTEYISGDVSGINEGNRGSAAPSISFDGRYIAFSSTANNLTVNGSNGVTHVYVRDRLARTNFKVIGSTGAEGNRYSTFPRITPDGRFVSFMSMASNLVLPDQNGAYDVLVYDLKTLMLTRESVTPEGREGNAESVFPTISGDGRFVAFESRAINLVPGVSSTAYRVYVRDRATCASGAAEAGRVSSAVRSVGPAGTLLHEQNCAIAGAGA